MLVNTLWRLVFWKLSNFRAFGFSTVCQSISNVIIELNSIKRNWYCNTWVTVLRYEPALPRRKKHPELAYMTQEFLRMSEAGGSDDSFYNKKLLKSVFFTLINTHATHDYDKYLLKRVFFLHTNMYVHRCWRSFYTQKQAWLVFMINTCRIVTFCLLNSSANKKLLL